MQSKLAKFLLALLLLGLSGCSKRVPSGPAQSSHPSTVSEISEADVVAYVEWNNLFNSTLKELSQQSLATLNSQGEAAYNSAMNSARRRMADLQSKKPFKGTVKGEALDQLMQAFFVSRRYFRDQKQLDVLQEKYGSLIETGARHEQAWRNLKIGSN